MTTGATYKVAVLGGGLVGSAIAYGLRHLGDQVAVFDEGDIAYRASRGNFGLVWVQSKGLGMPGYAEWTLRSASLWPILAKTLLDDTGIDVNLSQPGGLHLLLSEQEWQRREAFLTKLHGQPGFPSYSWEMLDRANLQTLYPDIGPEVVGASYTPLDGHVNPLRLLRAFHYAFGKHRVAYQPNQPVTQIDSVGDGFVLHTARGTCRAERIVLAAGLGNATLAPQVGLHAPVKPQRGQIVVLERVKPFLHHPILSLRQTAEGSVMIAESKDDPGFDDRTDLSILGLMANRAARMFPALEAVRVVRMWGALRVLSPDGLPIYQQSASRPGAFVATCHSGVTLAAAHALVYAKQVEAGQLDSNFEIFTGQRFERSNQDVSTHH